MFSGIINRKEFMKGYI